MADEYDKSSVLKVQHELLEQAKFFKDSLDRIAIRVGAVLVGSDDVPVDVTACNQLEVNEGIRCETASKQLTIIKGTPQELKKDATPLDGRTSIFVQPQDGGFMWGFSETELFFKITKGNLLEIKAPADVSIWAEPINGSKIISLTELK